MKNQRNRKFLSRTFRKQKDFRKPISAIVGDFIGNVDVPNRAGYIYVTINNRDILEVYNNRVATLPGIRVWIGVDPKEPHIIQVLGIRDNSPRSGPGSGNIPILVQPHHKTHEWFSPDGGTDVVFSHLRQFMPLRPTLKGGLEMMVFRGIAWLNDSWIGITGLTIDLSPYVPATGSRYVLVYEDGTGVPRAATGTVKDLLTLRISDIPSPVYGTLPIAAVRLYDGQTGIYETRDYTDIIDLRFPMPHTHSPRDNAILIYDDHVLEATGTAIDFGNGLDVSVTGTIVYVENTYDPMVTRQAIWTIEGDIIVEDNPVRIYNNFGFNLTITKVMLSVAVAAGATALTVDIHKDGTTIFTNQSHRPQITTGNYTGNTTTIDVSTWEENSYLTMHVDAGPIVSGFLTVHVVCEG